MRTFTGRAGLAAMAASAVVGAVTFVSAQPAFAAQYPPGPPLVLEPAVVCPGDSVTFHADGFAPLQPTTAKLLSKALLLGHFNADAQGDVDGTVEIPSNVRSGKHTFRLDARNPERELSAKLTVRKQNECGTDGVPPGVVAEEPGDAGSLAQPELAATGQDDTLMLFGGAAGLALLGGGAVVAVRRFGNS
ncbi:LPXTG cell wall anchor domain-containing protein [Streptomyces sp. SCSIO 30461]|uniref:LPXTG cell wall anchor domain-containing protein n=1 Tax=Streptomyces sp. SCSIO 30461 TaxID=3118085 RepID=UPI0030CD2366